MEGRFEDRWVLVEDDHVEPWPDDRRADASSARPRRAPHRAPGASRARRASSPTSRCPACSHGRRRALAARTRDASSSTSTRRARRAGRARRRRPGRRAVMLGRDARADGASPTYAGRRRRRARGERRRARRAPGIAALDARWTPLGFVVDLEQGLAEQRFTEDPSEERARRRRGRVRRGRRRSSRPSTAPRRRCSTRSSRTAPSPTGRRTSCTRGSRRRASSTRAASSRKRFDLDPDRVHVTCEFMGGGFGAKQGADDRGPARGAPLARVAGRPVRLFNDRRSEGDRRRPSRRRRMQTYRIGARRDGTLTAIEATAVVAMGDQRLVRAPVLDAGADALPLRERARLDVPACVLNLGFSNAFRAPGVMEGIVRLRAGDRRARRGARARSARAPPAQRRRRRPGRAACPTPPRTSIGRSTAPPSSPAGPIATRCATASTPDGRRRGLGAACQIWWGGGGPPAHALVRLGADGLATVVTGTQDIGTGITTVFAQVAAEELGLSLDRVRVETGTTRYGVYAPVSGGSQTTPSVAPAVRAAANDVRGQAARPRGRPVRGLGRRPRARRRRDRRAATARCASRSPR